MANDPKPNDDPSDEDLIAQISKMFDEVDPVPAKVVKDGMDIVEDEPTQ